MIFKGYKFREINLNDDAERLEDIISRNILYIFTANNKKYILKVFLDREFISNINGIINYIRTKLLDPRLSLISVPSLSYEISQKAMECLRTTFDVTDIGSVVDVAHSRCIYPALILPYIDGFDLYYNFKRIIEEYNWNEDDLRTVIMLLLAQVYILHNYLDIVHTDLTPANIILSRDKNCYIIDWECCYIRGYMPKIVVQLPNTNLVKPRDTNITPKYDIWYLGEVLFYLIVCLDPKLKVIWNKEMGGSPDIFFFLKSPVGLKHLEEIRDNTTSEIFPPDYNDLQKISCFNSSVSQDFIDLVRDCIDKYIDSSIFYKIYIKGIDYNDRPSIHDILESLRR